MVAIGRELDAAGQTIRHVLHEGIGILSIPRTNQPGHGQPSIGIKSNPGPHIGDALLATQVFGDVLLLAEDKND